MGELKGFFERAQESLKRYELMEVQEAEAQPGIQLLQLVLGDLDDQSRKLVVRRNAIKEEESPERKFLGDLITRAGHVKTAIDAEIHLFHEKNTMEKLKQGKGEYLWVQSPEGPQALGDETHFPPNVDPHQLRIKHNDKIKVPQTPGQVLDILVVAGGHGAVGALFGFARDIDWWRTNVVMPLVEAGVKAKCIVIDACHGASMVQAFAPLCSGPGALIIGNTIEGGVLITPDVWARLIADIKEKGGENVLNIIRGQVEERGREPGLPNPYGVFDPGSGNFYVDKVMGSLGLEGKNDWKGMTNHPSNTLLHTEREQMKHDNPPPIRGLEKGQLEGMISTDQSKRQFSPDLLPPEILEIAMIMEMLFQAKGEKKGIIRSILQFGGTFKQCAEQLESEFEADLDERIAEVTGKCNAEEAYQLLEENNWNVKTVIDKLMA
jgi:hypothetical protein